MRSLMLVAALVMLAAPAAAGPRARPTTSPPAAAATPSASPASSCREVVNGRGRTRKVCRIEKDIVVSTEAPRPQVLIVDAGGRKVVGKPKNEDRLADAPRHLP